MKTTLTAGLIAAAALMPAVAQASDKHASASTRVSVQRFEKVMPSRAIVWRTKCRFKSTWVYWHCTTRITGSKGYSGVFKVLVNNETDKAYIRSYQITGP
jgi:hypothetical protein